LAVVSLAAAACGGDDDTSDAATTTTTAAPLTVTTTTVAPTPPPALPVDVEVTADLSYTSQQKLDVYRPAEGSDWPVVVYLHGGNPLRDPEHRKQVEPVARAIAEQGVVVYVPTWNGMGPAGGSEESICALAFAHDTAAEYGGDPERVMPAGYSAGGYSAVIHALVGDDPPLSVTDCVVDPTIPAPAAVASGGGSLFVADWGRQGLLPAPEWTSLTPEQVDAFDPSLAVDAGRNPDVRIVLFVGEDDQGGNPDLPFPIAESNRAFDQAARQAGYDVDLIVVPGGHLEPIIPGTDQFAAWIETVAETAHGVG
jgi:acetyl esterase/lipase